MTPRPPSRHHRKNGCTVPVALSEGLGREWDFSALAGSYPELGVGSALGPMGRLGPHNRVSPQDVTGGLG